MQSTEFPIDVTDELMLLARWLPGLYDAQLRLLVYIAAVERQRETFRRSQVPRVAEYLGRSEKTITDTLRTLCQIGALYEHGRGNRDVYYTIERNWQPPARMMRRP